MNNLASIRHCHIVKGITTYINDGFGQKSINVWSFYDFPSS